LFFCAFDYTGLDFCVYLVGFCLGLARLGLELGLGLGLTILWSD